MAVFKGDKITTTGKEVVESRPDGIAKVRLLRGAVFYLTFARGELFVDRNLDKVIQFRQAAGLNSLPADNSVRGALRLPVVRILGMIALGMGLTFAVSQIIMGVVTVPVVIIGAAGLVILGLWAAAQAPRFTLAQVATRKNAVLGSLLAGTLTFTIALGALMSSAIRKMTAVSDDPNNAATRVVGMVVKMMSVLGLAPFHHDAGLAGTAALNTMGVTANILVGFFSIPIRLAIGAADVAFFKNRRSSTSIFGTTFRSVLAEAFKKTLAHAEETEYGFDYLENNMTRPAPGAVPLLSQDDVEEMMEILTSLGLIRFEGATPVDYSYKFKELIDEDHMSTAPLECETSLDPVSGMAKLVHRIVNIDFLFTDSKGKNLNLTKMPQKVIEGILNALDPAAYKKAYNQEQLEELFQQAGKYGPTFRAFFNAAVTKWEKRSIPKTLQTLVAFLKQGLLHEANHGLVLHLPEPDLIPAGTVSNEVLERYKKFSVKAYLTLLNTHLTQFPEWQTSAVFVKNLFKAMGETKRIADKRQNWDPKEKANYFLAHLITEMFNDRFEIFQLETSEKIEAYRKALNLSYNIPIGMLRDLENEMAKTTTDEQEKNAFLKRYSMTEAQFVSLQGELKAAEKASVYIATYGDPALSESERVFYNLFLDHLLHFEKEKNISFFKLEHTNGLLFQIMQTERIAAGKVGASEIIQESRKLEVEGPVGLAIAAAGVSKPTVTTISDQSTEPVKLNPENATAQAENPETPVAPILDMGIEETEPKDIFASPAVGAAAVGARQAVKMDLPVVGKELETTDPEAGTGLLDMSVEETTTENDTATDNAAKNSALRESQQRRKVEIQSSVVVAANEDAEAGKNNGAFTAFEKEDVEIGKSKISTLNDLRFSSSHQESAPVTQPVTPQQVNAANQALAPSRAAQIMPGLFDLWNTQPGPPPHLPGQPFYMYTNDPFLAAAVIGQVQQRVALDKTGAWGKFADALRIQIINPALGTQGVGAAAGAFSASKLGQGTQAEVLNALLAATPEGLPATGKGIGMIALTPGIGAAGNLSGGATNVQAGISTAGTGVSGAIIDAPNLTVGETGLAGVGMGGKNAGAASAEDVLAAQTRLNGQLGTTGMVFPNGKIGIPLHVVAVPLSLLLNLQPARTPGRRPAQNLCGVRSCSSQSLNSEENWYQVFHYYFFHYACSPVQFLG